MERRKRTAAIALAAVFALGIGAGVVRCAAVHGQQEDQQAQEAAATDAGTTQETAPEDDAQDALAVLQSHAWQAEGDPSVTIEFRDGSFVETDASGVHVTAMEVAEASETSLDVHLVRDGGDGEVKTAIALTGEEGSWKLSSDGFSCAHTYVETTPHKEAVAVEGVTEPYTTLIEGRTDELALAIAAYCRAHAPTATRATFDGEVYLDTNAGTVTATFHCDDAAATILQVTYEGGAFAVAG